METKVLTGIIGYPLSHSLSPIIHNACYDRLSLNWCYVPFEAKSDISVDSLLKYARESNIAGLNVTMPYKETVLSMIDELTPEAQKIGAVNTIKISNNKTVGYNTDAIAIMKVLKEEYGKSLKNKTVVLLGAGGVAKAAAYVICSLGCNKIFVVNRTEEKADKLKKIFKSEIADIDLIASNSTNLIHVVQGADIVINATPIGMFPNVENVPINTECLGTGQFVMDLIYHPAKTRFVKEATRKGSKTIGGVPMFINQAAESFKIWTGISPPKGVMEAVIKDFLEA